MEPLALQRKNRENSEAAEPPALLNPYQYALNNPVLYVDANGLSAMLNSLHNYHWQAPPGCGMPGSYRKHLFDAMGMRPGHVAYLDNDIAHKREYMNEKSLQDQYCGKLLEGGQAA